MVTRNWRSRHLWAVACCVLQSCLNGHDYGEGGTATDNARACYAARYSAAVIHELESACANFFVYMIFIRTVTTNILCVVILGVIYSKG
jgi:hypothetical protein